MQIADQISVEGIESESQIEYKSHLQLSGWDWMSSSRNFLVVFHWIDPPKDSQNFVEKAHYPDATPLKISTRLNPA